MTPGEIEEAAIRTFKETPNKRLSTHKELRFGSHGSISVCLTGERAGCWYSHEQQKGGRIRIEREDPVPYERPAPRPPRTFEPSDSAARCRQILTYELCDIDSPQAYIRRSSGPSPARLYLQSRGIDASPHSVRAWAGRGIAFVAQAADGSNLAVQVMNLHVDGSKNTAFWNDGVVKRTYCMVRGWNHVAAVRMPGKGKPVLCEGPETGMSIWLATRRPVLACLGLAGMSNLRMIAKSYTIACDRDPPGSGADAATQRLISLLPDHCNVVIPPPSDTKQDFNDIHMKHGLAAVREIVNESNRLYRGISQTQDSGRGDQRRHR